jgi:L-amino acid N-acyltransferase YncA
VSLQPGEPEPMALRAAEIYAELAVREPELTLWVNPEDLDSLTECAEEGLLLEVLADGEPAGVVAAQRYDAHALTGFSVQELCLDSEHRGRRLAPAAVQRLVDLLPAVPGDVLWGTIHPGNLPSLRNALSIGRTLVGGYVWVTPAGLPGMPDTWGG